MSRKKIIAMEMLLNSSKSKMKRRTSVRLFYFFIFFLHQSNYHFIFSSVSFHANVV